MDDEIKFCDNCGTELLQGLDDVESGLCNNCFDEDKAELSFLDELIDFGGEG